MPPPARRPLAARNRAGSAGPDQARHAVSAAILLLLLALPVAAQEPPVVAQPEVVTSPPVLAPAAPEAPQPAETPAPVPQAATEPTSTTAPALPPAEPEPLQAAAPAPTPGAGPEAPAATASAAAAAEPPAVEATLPHDLSPWGMFLAADMVVQSVMVGLIVASIITWTIWLAKTLEYLGAGIRLRRGLAAILTARDLAAAEQVMAWRRGPAAQMVRAAAAEAAVSASALPVAGGAGLQGRVSSSLSRIEAQAGRRLAMGTGLLATIGAIAPFVGLFGTVWGIMNSFIGISRAQTTNLAVVAPGIAEALLATALGLGAAIPAVLIYNFFARWGAGYRTRLADAAAAVERLVSRDIDHRRIAPPPLNRAAE